MACGSNYPHWWELTSLQQGSPTVICIAPGLFLSQYVTSTVSAGTNQNFCCFIQPNFDFVFHVEVWQPTCVWRGSINQSGCADNCGISIEMAPHILQFLRQFLFSLDIKGCPRERNTVLLHSAGVSVKIFIWGGKQLCLWGCSSKWGSVRHLKKSRWDTDLK